MDARILHIAKPFSMLPPELAQFQNIDYFVVNKLLSVRPLDGTQSISNLNAQDEQDFLQKYERDFPDTLVSLRQKEHEERKERQERRKAQVLERAEAKNLIDMERLDMELAKRIEEEEHKRIQFLKDEQDRRDKMAIQIMTVAKIPIEEAQKLLEIHKWSYPAVVAQLQEEERKENLIMQAIGTFNIDYDNAKVLLDKARWNFDAATRLAGAGGLPKQPAQSQQQQVGLIGLNLVILQDLRQVETLKCSFHSQAEGMVILDFLQQTRPLPSNPQMYYHLYLDSQLKNNISYIDLTNPIQTLKFYDKQALYVVKSTNPPL